jgi:hypothetical protein
MSTMTGAGAVAADEGAEPVEPQGRRSFPGWVVVGGLLAILTTPLLVALGVLHGPRWYPMADLAMTELRVRDVVRFDHPPQVGLPGRITGFGEAGSHPGPLSFYALAPVYWLTGGTAWGLKVGVVVLDTVALGMTLAMVHRRGGPLAALSLATGLAVLLRGYGTHQLTEPWNPFMPQLWWLVFVVAVWCVLCDALPLLPVVVFAGSFCTQTHISYVPLVAVLVALAFGWVLVDGHRRRAEPDRRRRTLLWGGGSLLLAGVLWAPPLAEQAGNHPGNLSIIVENFRHPTQPQVSLVTARDIWLARLDPVGLVTGDPRPGSWVATLCGLALLALWLGTVALAWRRTDLPGRRELLRLHLVLGVTLVVGFASISRIIGVPWYYLHLWAMGTTTLVVVAGLWTAFAAAGRPLLVAPTEGAAAPAPAAPAPAPTATGGATDRWTGRERRVAVAGLAALGLVVTGIFTFDAAYTEVPVARLTRTLRHVAPDAIDALTAADAPGGGKDGRYLVNWIDPIGIGEHGWGLLDEMERAGLDVYANPFYAVPVRPHRLLGDRTPTAVVTVVGGPAIEDVRDDPDQIEIAYFEPRTPAQRERFDELRADVEAEVEAAGLGDRVDLDNSLFTAAQTPGLSDEAGRDLGEMIDLGLPLAVFVEPVEPAGTGA